MTAARRGPGGANDRTGGGSQLGLFAPDAAVIVQLVRENLRLLEPLVARVEVARRIDSGDAGDAENGGDSDAAGRAVIRNPDGVVRLLGTELAALQQEQLRVVLLDTQNTVLGTRLVYQGGLNTTAVVSLADFFREAVRIGANAIVLAHNHPSGDPTPSPEDIRITGEIGRAGDLLGIEVLDHIVIGRGRHVSLREQGLYAYRPCQVPAGSTAPLPVGESDAQAARAASEAGRRWADATGAADAADAAGDDGST